MYILEVMFEGNTQDMTTYETAEAAIEALAATTYHLGENEIPFKIRITPIPEGGAFMFIDTRKE